MTSQPQSDRQDDGLCEDCPPVGYETARTRCLPCPRRATRDAAEGAEKVDPCPVCGINNNSPFPCVDHVAPPKPAPDAMRGALEAAHEYIKNCGTVSWWNDNRRFDLITNIIQPALRAAPVPPADDGMVDLEALIAKYRGIHSKEAQFIALCIEAWSPSPAVAAELVAEAVERLRQYASVMDGDAYADESEPNLREDIELVCRVASAPHSGREGEPMTKEQGENLTRRAT